MDDGSADLVAVSQSNLGRLHPDFPMDPNEDRFKQKLRACLLRLEGATDQLVGALIQFETTGNEVDLRKARDIKSSVQEFRHDVLNLRSDPGPEVEGECDQALRTAEWELSQIGTRLNTAALSSVITPVRTSVAPAHLAGGGFWEPVSDSPTIDHVFNLTFPDTSFVIDTVSTPWPLFQVAAVVHDVNLNQNPPTATHASSIHRRPGHNSSVASSQQEMREVQNGATRTARQAQDLINEEEQNLEEEGAIIAAKTK
jgi:hypothetical protein